MNPVESSESIDYKQRMYSHSEYKLTPVYPNNFGVAIALNNGQSQSTINVPPDVFNLSKSFLKYTVTLPAAADNTWIHTQAIWLGNRASSVLWSKRAIPLRHRPVPELQ